MSGTSAKKPVPSLTEMQKSKEDSTNNKVDETTKNDSVKNVEDKQDPEVILDDKTGPVVTDGVHTPNVEENGSPNRKDDLGNPDGVTPSGGGNVIDKTPADLAAETPEETQKRYGINDKIPDDVHNDPNVTTSRDNRIPQIATGTHLHPDVARDNYNSSLGVPSEAAVVTRTVSQNVFAGPSEIDDKGFPEERKVEALKDDTTFFSKEAK